jgi:prepilin-type N-terminal cleavage/methylation domain-containing protein
MKNAKQSGMTLIEIIVSIAIIAILAAGLTAVGSYVDKQIKIKKTLASMHILVTAVDQYYDFYRKFPDPNGAYPSTTYFDPSGTEPNNIEKLYYKLTLAPDAKKVLDQINRKSFKDADKDDNLEIVDIWGENFRYRYMEGWNFPEIISAGPDKDFGDYYNVPSDPEKYKIYKIKIQDNISSKNF